ncbi:hypothetical protein QWY90_07800 [Flavobacterium paronense]|uniref:Uncharacterized protein n=1 Tax=Flavobacterium paronense TaxID=1392775 RepID=A0ABV5GGW4_9FLAO|nr:hypothetical protein [Flavobacterium paronense]MDN3677215.1 hypothetical protein [Flavobacterium paronense]
MTKLFKKIALTLLVVSLNLTYAQNKELDSLIQKIDNKEAYIVLTKTTSPRVKGTDAKRIIEIGKMASPELIKVLDSQNKGIIAHFILSEIWKNIGEEEVCCAIRNVGEIEILTINGLEIQIENNVLFSTSENLKKNQQVWKTNCHV